MAIRVSAPNQDERIATRNVGTVSQRVSQLEACLPRAGSLFEHIDLSPPNFAAAFLRRIRKTHAPSHDQHVIARSYKRAAKTQGIGQVGQICPFEEILFRTTFGANRH